MVVIITRDRVLWEPKAQTETHANYVCITMSKSTGRRQGFKSLTFSKVSVHPRRKGVSEEVGGGSC